MFRGLRRVAWLIVASVLVASSSALAGQAAVAPAPQIELVGFPQSFTLNEAALRALPRSDYTKTMHDEEATWRGARLSDVLKQAGAPLGEKLRGAALRSVLRVQAADGYAVVFSLAEFDQAFGSSVAILAFERDGKALSAEEGPFRLIVPRDHHAARSVRQVTKIELRTLD